MRISRFGWFAIVAVVAMLALLFLSTGWQRRDYRMADGSVLRLEKVSFGKPLQIRLGGLREKILERLPPALVARFSKPRSTGTRSWYQNTPIHTNDNALFIYISRRETASGAYRSVDIASVQLLDEHGCVFTPTQAGGEDDGRLASTAPGMGGYSVAWFRFEAFPRREREFRFQTLGGQNDTITAEFKIINPAPPPVAPTNWVVQSLPITQSNGSVSFTLASLKLKTVPPSHRSASGGWIIDPKYEVTEDGKPSDQWQALDSELWDSTGNFVSDMGREMRSLCPWEPSWKLRVKFFGTEESPAASNTRWTLRHLEVPASGKLVDLGLSQDTQGVMLKAVYFCGAGDYVFSNAVPVEVSPLAEPYLENSLNETWKSGSGIGVRIEKLHANFPCLMVDIGKLTDDQRLTVRATDDQGRTIYGYELNRYGINRTPKRKPGEVHYFEPLYLPEPSFVTFDLPADAVSVDIAFCIHNCATPEFIFKPPPPDAPEGPEKAR